MEGSEGGDGIAPADEEENLANRQEMKTRNYFGGGAGREEHGERGVRKKKRAAAILPSRSCGRTRGIKAALKDAKVGEVKGGAQNDERFLSAIITFLAYLFPTLSPLSSVIHVLSVSTACIGNRGELEGFSGVSDRISAMQSKGVLSQALGPDVQLVNQTRSKLELSLGSNPRFPSLDQKIHDKNI